MSLDKVVVIVLALLFFGGIILVTLKNRQAKGGEDHPLSPSADPRDENSVSPIKPGERRSKR